MIQVCEDDSKAKIGFDVKLGVLLGHYYFPA
jgi:hypothetical protein